MNRNERELDRHQPEVDGDRLTRRSLVKNHPHHPGCSRTRDIIVFNKKYPSDLVEYNFTAFQYEPSDYRTRCKECGAESCRQELTKESRGTHHR